jgi:hypothetical protein
LDEPHDSKIQGAILMSTFYRVYEDTSHLVDMDDDIQFSLLIENGKRINLGSDDDDLVNLITLIRDNLREETLINPQVIYAEGVLEALEHTDIPITRGSQLLVISKRLLDLLLTIKPFDYRAIPLVIVDDTEREIQFLPSGEVRPGVKTNTNYVLVKLLRHVPMDREKSIYRQKIFEGKESISGISKLELIEPEDGLDPIFRVKETSSSLFVTEEAQIKMEQHGIQGIAYYESMYIM